MEFGSSIFPNQVCRSYFSMIRSVSSERAFPHGPSGVQMISMKSEVERCSYSAMMSFRSVICSDVKRSSEYPLEGDQMGPVSQERNLLRISSTTGLVFPL